MTKEEAIYRLKNTAWLGSDDDREEAEEAVTMAIKALEDIERWRTWSHTYDNLISRQDAIDAVIAEGRSVDSRYLEAERIVHESDAVEALSMLPSADRPKNMIHIDDVYRLIAGHSDYHGDSILSAFTCLVEGKDVKDIAPLDESVDRPTGKWVKAVKDGVLSFADIYAECDQCHKVTFNGWNMDYCPKCGAKMRGEAE